MALFREDYPRFMWIYFLVRHGELAWASRLFLADTRFDGETEIIRADCGGEFDRFAELCDRFKIQCEFMIPDTRRLSGCTERRLASWEFTHVAARVRAGTLFRYVKMPNTTDYFRV